MNKIYNALREQKDMKIKGNLYHATQIRFSYNTNRIEGSGLTEEETRYIYETNTLKSDEAVNIDDVIETTNHFKMFDYMIGIVYEKLDESIIKEFHRLLKTGTSSQRLDWFNIGEYKKLPNEVGGITTSAPENVGADMLDLLSWYNSLEKIDSCYIIEFHYRFERIHPFQDGNGRVGRIIMFKEALKNNIMPFIIEDAHKLFYYRGLKEYKNEKGYLVDTILSAQDSYDLLCKSLGII